MYTKFCILLLLVSCHSISFAAVDEQAGFYIERFGRADSKDPLVARAYKVFQRVKAVADKKQHRWAKLIIINQTRQLFAVALPDGNIVLSKHAIDRSYKNVKKQQGDARLAFIFGHELAHLANDDFWHKEFFQAVKAKDIRQILKRYDKNSAKTKEIAADDRGFVYAAMAGYDVQFLARSDNFLDAWQGQAPKQVIHPQAKERKQLLISRFTTLLDKLSLFKIGVQLSHFDRCDDAIYFLTDFQKYFPSREVLNNLGYCHLQTAKNLLHDPKALYWTPSLLDTESLLAKFSRGSTRGIEESYTSSSAQHLERARELLIAATQADKYYTPAFVNLAITNLYLNEVYDARAAIEKAYHLTKKAKQDTQNIEALRAIILYKEGEGGTDTWVQAMDTLRTLAQQPNASPMVIYNTALLLKLRKRSGDDVLWQRLSQQVADLPIEIQSIVCEKYECTYPNQLEKTKAWQRVIPMGTYIKGKAELQSKLKKWQKTYYDLGTELYGDIYHTPAQNTSLLTLVGYTELLSFKPKTPVKVDQLDNYCGSYLQQQTTATGRVISCDDWAALIYQGENTVAEVWIGYKD